MNYQEIIESVASSTGIPKSMVLKIHKAYWRAIREYITSLPLKEDLSAEEFNKLKPNVNIPSLGKLYVDCDRYQIIKKKYSEITNVAPPVGGVD